MPSPIYSFFFTLLIPSCALRMARTLRRFLGTTALAVWALAASCGHACGQTLLDNSYFGVHGPSYHDGGDFNNDNYGLYLVHKGFTGGTYYNSLRRTTWYAGYSWEWALPSNPLADTVSLMGSLATGYHTAQYSYDYVPLGALSVRRALWDQHGLRLSYLPVLGKSPASYVLHLGYEYAWP